MKSALITLIIRPHVPLETRYCLFAFLHGSIACPINQVTICLQIPPVLTLKASPDSFVSTCAPKSHGSFRREAQLMPYNYSTLWSGTSRRMSLPSLSHFRSVSFHDAHEASGNLKTHVALGHVSILPQGSIGAITRGLHTACFRRCISQHRAQIASTLFDVEITLMCRETHRLSGQDGSVHALLGV